MYQNIVCKDNISLLYISLFYLERYVTFCQYMLSLIKFEDDGTFGAIYECTGRRPKCTKGHFKQHDLFMYHISRE